MNNDYINPTPDDNYVNPAPPVPEQPSEQTTSDVYSVNDTNIFPDEPTYNTTISASESDDAPSESGYCASYEPAQPVSENTYDASSSAQPSSINMQFTPKKTPKWLVALVVSFMSVFFAVLILLCVVVFNMASERNLNGNFGSASPGVSGEYGSEGNYPEVDEHMQITDSPTSEGAKTADGALTVKQISEKVRESVVGVSCKGSSSFSDASVGSGIIMSEDGYIITNNHVIEGMTTIQVILDNGEAYSARLIGADSRSDLAVIKIEATGLKAAEFGDSDKLEQGDPAVAIGNPSGLELQNTVTYGIISAINRDIVVEDRTMTLIQTDASINPGNSGGPLLNEFGQVIGINTIKVGISYYEGLGFAIPINTAKPIIDELISRGYIVGRPSIGINGRTLTERDAAIYDLPAGLYVDYVHPYSDAYKKGLRRGDVITKMNGTSLNSIAEIKKIRDNFQAGDTVTLTVFRNAQVVEIDVILMDEATLSEYDN